MAARYWVGGSGNWSDAANHWSDASNGTPGAGFLPTSEDDVYLDQYSGTANFTLTFTGSGTCRNFDTSGLIYICTIADGGSQKNLNIYGSINIPGTYFNGNTAYQFRMNFYSSGNETITYPNAYNRHYYFLGSGKWTFQSDFTSIVGGFFHYNGEIDLNGYTVRLVRYSTMPGTKTLTLSNSEFKMVSWNNSYPDGFTFNNTGTVVLTYGITDISGYATSFYNLSLLSYSGNTTHFVTVYCDVEVTNILTIKGLSQSARQLVKSSTIGTIRILTAETVSAEYADFIDIQGAGNGDWDLSAITGGAGDGGGNQDIIFTAPKTCYWYGSGTSYATLSRWFSGSGGTGTANYFPLMQDDVIFDQNSLSANATVTMNTLYVCKNFDSSAITKTLTLSSSLYFEICFFGNVNFSSSMRITVASETSGLVALRSRADTSINFAGVDIKALFMYSYGCIVTFTGSFSASVRGMYVYNVTFDLNGYDMTVKKIQLTGGYYYLGSGIITVTQNNYQPFYLISGVIYPETSTVKFQPATGGTSASLYLLVDANFNKLEFCGENIMEFVYSNKIVTINELKVSAGKRLHIQPSSNALILNGFVADGTVSQVITIKSSSPLSSCRLFNNTLNDFVVSYCDISYMTVSGTPKIKTFMDKTWDSMGKAMGIAKAGIKKILGIYVNSAWIARDSTDSGNNSGWNFE